jgi:hypothetical protein
VTVRTVERWAELRREHFVRGVSIKELVRRTGLARNTIRVALRSDEPPAFQVPDRSSKLKPFKDETHGLLTDDPKLPGVRIRELTEPLRVGGTAVNDYRAARTLPQPSGRRYARSCSHTARLRPLRCARREQARLRLAWCLCRRATG